MSTHVQLHGTASSIYEYASQFLSGRELTKTILLVGSGPEAVKADELSRNTDIVVAINHAHKAVSRVSFSFYAGDFPESDKHARVADLGVTIPQYLAAAQRFGGLIYCGASMFYLASYWVIQQFPFSLVKVIGCDMAYSGQSTHFYGLGAADPLRKNISLQSLEAKSLRVLYFSLKHGVFMCNLSSLPDSRLRFPHLTSPQEVDYADIVDLCKVGEQMLQAAAQRALELERDGPVDTANFRMRSFDEDSVAWQYARNVDNAWLALEERATEWRLLVESKLG